MATRTTAVKIGVVIDQAQTKAAAAELRNFFATARRERENDARTDARTATTITRETEKQNLARGKSAATLAAHEERLNDRRVTSAKKTVAAEIGENERLVRETKRKTEERARYEYQTQQRSRDSFILFLREAENAELQSFGRRNRLLKERQRLEAEANRPSGLTGAILTSRFTLPGTNGAVQPLVGRSAKALGVANEVAAAAAITGAGLAAALPMANQFADKASDMNETLSKSVVVLGDSAKGLEEWSRTSAKTMGLSRRDAIENVASLALLYRQTGANQQSLTSFGKEALQRAADVASLNNTVGGTAAVLDKLRSGLNGEIEPLRSIGVFLSQGRIQAEAFALGIAKPIKDAPKIEQAHKRVEIAAARLGIAQKKYGDGSIETANAQLGLEKAEGALTKALAGSAKELTTGQKMQAAYSLYLKDTKVAQGNYALTAKDLANAQRSANAEWENTQVILGQKILPLKKEVVGFLSDMLDKFNSLDSATQSWVVKIGGFGLLVMPFVISVGKMALAVQGLRVQQELLARTPVPGAGGVAGGVAGAAGKGFLGGFGLRLGAAAISTAPITVPLLATGALAYSTGATQDSIAQRDLNALYGSNAQRIKTLKTQRLGVEAAIQKARETQARGNTGSQTADSYMMAMQADPPQVGTLKTQIAAIDKEIAVLSREQKKVQRRAAEAAKAATTTATQGNVDFRVPSDRARMNPSVIADLAAAEAATGIKIGVGTAISGHSKMTTSGHVSRHGSGNAVDISTLNGVSYKSDPKKFTQIANALTAYFESTGAARNVESGNQRAVLFGFNDRARGGNHLNHIHYSNTGGPARPGTGAPYSDAGDTGGLYSGAAQNAGVTKRQRIAEAAQRKADADRAKAAQDDAELARLRQEGKAQKFQTVQDRNRNAFDMARNGLSAFPSPSFLANFTGGGEDGEAAFRSEAEKKITATIAELRRLSGLLLDARLSEIEEAYKKAIVRDPKDRADIAAQKVANAKQVRLTAIGQAQGDYKREQVGIDDSKQDVYKRVRDGLTESLQKQAAEMDKNLTATQNYLTSQQAVTAANLERAKSVNDFDAEEAYTKEGFALARELAQFRYALAKARGETGDMQEAFAALTTLSTNQAANLKDLAARREAAQISEYTNNPYVQFGDAIGDKFKGFKDPRAKGMDRFVQDPQTGRWHDRTTGKEVSAAQVDVRRTTGEMGGAARESVGALLGSLRNGDKMDPNGLIRNLGKQFGEIGARALERRLIDGPLEKAFDRIGDKLSDKIAGAGGKGGEIFAAAAMVGLSALTGKGGKKKQKGALLGTGLGLLAGSLLPGVSLLQGAGIGSALGSLFGFAGGGKPPTNRAVMVGEYGPELAVFRSPADILNAPDTKRAISGTRNLLAGGGAARATDPNNNGNGGNGGGIYGPLVHIGTITDKPAATMLVDKLISDMDGLLLRTGG